MGTNLEVGSNYDQSPPGIFGLQLGVKRRQRRNPSMGGDRIFFPEKGAGETESVEYNKAANSAKVRRDAMGEDI